MGRHNGGRGMRHGKAQDATKGTNRFELADFGEERGLNTRNLIPFSHFTDEDHDFFYDTMGLLLTYANEVMCVVDEKTVTLSDPERWRMDNGTLVSEALWQHREVMDIFVRQNPYGLPEEQIDLVRSWEYGVHDIFTCIDADANCALYMNSDHIFAVGAMDGDADEHVHAIPSLMLLTLLPYKGGIVTDSKTLHLSDQVHRWAEDGLEECSRQLIAAGEVALTSTDLLRYWLTHQGVNQITPYCQKIIDAHLDTLRTPSPALTA